MISVNIFSQRYKLQIYNKTLQVSLYNNIRQTIYNLLDKYNYFYNHRRCYLDDVKEELLIYQDNSKRINGELLADTSLKEFLLNDYPTSSLDAIEVLATILINQEDIDWHTNFEHDINNLFYNNRLPYQLATNQIIIENIINVPASISFDMKKLKEDIENNIIKRNFQLVVDRLHTYYGLYLQEIVDKIKLQSEKDSNNHIVFSKANKKIAEYLYDNKLITEFEKSEIIYANSLLEQYNKVRNNASFAHPNSVISNESAEFIVQIFSATLSLLDSCLKKGGLI